MQVIKAQENYFSIVKGVYYAVTIENQEVHAAGIPHLAPLKIFKTSFDFNGNTIECYEGPVDFHCKDISWPKSDSIYCEEPKVPMYITLGNTLLYMTSHEALPKNTYSHYYNTLLRGDIESFRAFLVKRYIEVPSERKWCRTILNTCYGYNI